MKTINIKGKEYVEVNERLKHFRANHPKYSLTSEVIEKTDSSILILATIKDDKDRPIATGIAEEIKGSTFINKTSYVDCQLWGKRFQTILDVYKKGSLVAVSGNGEYLEYETETGEQRKKFRLNVDKFIFPEKRATVEESIPF